MRVKHRQYFKRDPGTISNVRNSLSDSRPFYVICKSQSCGLQFSVEKTFRGSVKCPHCGALNGLVVEDGKIMKMNLITKGRRESLE